MEIDMVASSREISESARREAPGKKKKKIEECSRKNAGFAWRTRITLLDPSEKSGVLLGITHRFSDVTSSGVSEQTETVLMTTPPRVPIATHSTL